MRERAQMMQRLNVEMAQVGKYLEVIQGRQWAKNRPRYKSPFVDNRIAKTRYDDLAQLTDARPTIDITTSIDAYKDIAKALDALVHIEWSRKSIDLKLVTAADICKAYGTSFWKMGASKPGNSTVLPCGPDQVLPINPSFDIQESTGVLYRTWKDPMKLKRQFPLCSDHIEREADSAPVYGLAAGDSTYLRPAHIDQYVWNALNPGMQRVLGVKNATAAQEPMAAMFNALEVEEYWIDDGTENDSLNSVIVRDPYLNMDAHNWWYEVAPKLPLYPRKRLMTFVGKRVIYDGPSPFWHGLYPFPTLRLNPVFFSFWGLSKYRDLVPVNMAMNEIVAGVLDLVKRVLNPTTVTTEGSIATTAWKEFYPDMPGMKLKGLPGRNAKDLIHYADSPEIPAYVFQMLAEFLGPEFDRLAGNVDVQAMMKKAQVPGGDTIDQMRDAMATGLRMEGRMIERFLEDAGTQFVSNALQFYTPAQMIKLLGEAGLTTSAFRGMHGTMIPESQANHPDFWRSFALTVKPGSLHAGAHDRLKMAVTVAAQSGLVSKQFYLRTMQFDDPDRIMRELVEENTPHPNQDPNDPQSEPVVPEASGRSARTTRSSRNGSPM